jgi:hypothetical protein
VTVLKYDYGIEYGDFTSIYTHHKKNKQVVQEIVENKDSGIYNKLIHNESVFVIGYGASGAGKTSSLIKLVKFDENKHDISDDGIFIELCKKLKVDDTIDDEITLNVAEMFGGIGGKSEVKSVKQLKFKWETREVLTKPKPTAATETADKPTVDGATTETDFFLVTSPEINAELSQYKSIWKDGDEYPGSLFIENGELLFKEKSPDNKNPKTIEFGKKLGNVIVNFVDNYRMVAPTTNNPRSSRSHILIDLVLTIKNIKNNGNESHLIIGDFAGVENTFMCESQDVKELFATLVRPEDEIKGKPQFYVRDYFLKQKNTEIVKEKDPVMY